MNVIRASPPVPGCRSPVPAVRLLPSRSPVPGPRSRRNDDGLWRQARTAAGQADSSALAVDSPGPLGRGGPRHPPPSFSCVRLGGRLGAGAGPTRARRSPRRPGRKGGWRRGRVGPPPRPTRPRLHPAYAEPRPMKWASRAGASAGERDRRLCVGARLTSKTRRHVGLPETRPGRHGDSATSWAAKCCSPLALAVRAPSPCRFGSFLPGPWSQVPVPPFAPCT